MSCIYDYDSPCECDIEACRTCYKNPDKPEPDCDFMRDLETTTVDPAKEHIVNEVHDPIIGGGFVIKNEKSKVILLKKYMTEIGINIIGTMSLKDYEDFKKYKEEN